MKRSAISLFLACVFIPAAAQPKQIHILAINDMHAQVQYLPQVSAIVDSLRAIDQDLLVISAGDNCGGGQVNDNYTIKGLPMVGLMNYVGFSGSCLGNHEFDFKPEGLAQLIKLSNFPYICANIHPDPSLGITVSPYKIYEIKGVKVAMLGVIQLGRGGIPTTSPDNVKGITFTPAADEIARYNWLREASDVYILLSHLGYNDDVKTAESNPQFDLIIGGHSHTQIDGGELHNGVLITQNTNKLKLITYITITVENGKVTGKEAVNISVQDFPEKDKAAEVLYEFYRDDPDRPAITEENEHRGPGGPGGPGGPRPPRGPHEPGAPQGEPQK